MTSRSPSSSRRRSPSLYPEEKVTLLNQLIPPPGHPRASLRTAATAIVFIFCATVIFIALGGSVGRGEADRENELGVGWVGWQAVDWGSRVGKAQELGTTEKDDGVPVVEPVAEEGGEEELDATVPAAGDAKEEVAEVVASIAVGTFGIEVSTNVDNLFQNGSLSRYVWHEDLKEDAWSANGENRLVVVGQSPSPPLLLPPI